jgi:branched-chain amino acid transport system substrate-binding protein
MNRRDAITLKLTFAALVAMGATGLSPQEAQAQSGDAIRIGLVSPNTGGNARYGAFAQRGARLAAQEINAAGGVAGRKIELFVGDSQCVPTEGVSATKRLIESDKVAFLIGDICSSVTLAMQPLAESAGVLLMNAASSNPQITYKAGVGGFKWSFRNYPTDENRAAIVLKYAAEQRKFTKYAVLSVDSDYGRGAIAFTKKYLPTFKSEILSEDYYKDGETDFRPVLAKIRNSGAQAILMYGLADTTPIIARQMLESGLAGKIALVGNAEFNAANTIKAAPSVMNGAVEAAAWLPEYDSALSKQFVQRYQAAYSGEMPNNHAYTHYDTVHLLAAAMKQANATTPAAVRDIIPSLKYESGVGPTTFDDHNQARLPMILLEVADGKPAIKGAFHADIDYPKP